MKQNRTRIVVTLVPLFFGIASLAGGADEWTPFARAEQHMLVVTSRGQPVQPQVYRCKKRDGKWKYKVGLRPFAETATEQKPQYKDYIDKLIKSIETNGDGRIMFFIHGGMNFVSGATERAAMLIGADHDEKPGYKVGAQGYPIFICWDSPPTGYGEQLAWVRAGKTERYGRSVGHKIFAVATLPFHLLADLGRGLTRFPAELSQFAYNDLYSIEPRFFSEYKKMQEETLYLRGEAKNHPNGTFISPTEPHVDVSRVERPKSASRYFADFQTAALFPIRTLTLPVLDSIGVGAWDNMLRHTETMFDRTDTEIRKSKTPVEKAVEADQTGAVAMFFAKLDKVNRQRKCPFEITLIGHSMGTIVVNRIINSYPNLRFSNIVYMGAACSVRDFENSVPPYLARDENKNSSFYGLSLHPRCEAGEMAVSPGRFSLDAAPRGSLPVWIDNIFAHPPSEGQRRFGIFQTAVLASHNIPPQVRSRVHLKCFEFGAVKSNDDLIHCPQHHGDFGKGPYWESSFWQVDETPPSAEKKPHAKR